jgi:hypothetical protein
MNLISQLSVPSQLGLTEEAVIDELLAIRRLTGPVFSVYVHLVPPKKINVEAYRV